METKLSTILGLIIACTCANPGKAQQVATMPAASVMTYDHRLRASDSGFDLAVKCQVPALSIGVVTFARRWSAGPSRHDIEITDAAQFSAPQTYTATNVIAQANGGGSLPVVLPIAASLENQTKTIIIHARDNTPAKYVIYCDNVSIPKQIAFSLLKTLVVSFLRDEFGGSSFAASDNAARIGNLAFAAFQRDNLLSMGVDAVREEVVIALRKQFPQNPDLVVFLASMVVDTMQEGYEHAFHEIANAAR